MSSELLARLARLVGEADARDDVDVLILTGADPAFCAGLDLKELGRDGGPLKRDPGRAAAAAGTTTASATAGSGPEGHDPSHVQARHRRRQRRRP